MKKENIVLIGMPGVGKSTIGVVLAKVLGYEFIDADLLIQKAEGKLLREIIEEKGTDGFIEVENRVNSQIRTTHSVIATGGSVVYGKEAMEHLGSIGTIVLKPGQTLAGLYKERVVLYEKYADIIVDEYKLNVEQTLDAVLQALKEKNGTEKAEDE